MTIEELRQKLMETFPEAMEEDIFFGRAAAHMAADQLLLEFIGDEEVTRIFDAAEKWYS